jgi:hypothetical protein
MSSTTQNEPNATVATSPSSTRVTSRHVVSAPTHTIQVERVSISEAQKSSVTSAIREGRKAAGKSESQ